MSNLSPSREYVTLTFMDQAIGFQQQYAERIFTIFYRLNERKAYSGTVIRLALCNTVDEDHGGVMQAFGKPGQGATFTIGLPIAT